MTENESQRRIFLQQGRLVSHDQFVGVFIGLGCTGGVFQADNLSLLLVRREIAVVNFVSGERQNIFVELILLGLLVSILKPFGKRSLLPNTVIIIETIVGNLVHEEQRQHLDVFALFLEFLHLLEMLFNRLFNLSLQVLLGHAAFLGVDLQDDSIAEPNVLQSFFGVDGFNDVAVVAIAIGLIGDDRSLFQSD